MLLTLLVTLCGIMPSYATTLEEDKTAARILVYFTVGRDTAPATNVTLDQFTAHIEELVRGDYTVLPLEEVIAAYEKDTPLPPNSIALSFDGGDKTVLTHAMPLLQKHKLPFTVFLATSRTDANDPRYLSWDDVRLMLKSPLVSIGLHPENYTDISALNAVNMRSRINNATARLREETSTNTTFFAYPFGEYSAHYQNMVSAYGFKAAFGQQSGVATATSDRFALPRFTMTENYANAERFKMTVSSLPLPVTDITPKASHVNTLEPAIGFTVSEPIKNLSDLNCFASGQEKPDINIIGESRVEIRLKQPINDTRFRVNCTLTKKEANSDEIKNWRWFGYLMTVNDTMLAPMEETSKTPDQ